jgi:transposase
MRKIREMVRLAATGLSPRQIAVSVDCALSTVQGCLRRIAAARLTWPLPESLDDVALEQQLYPRKVSVLDTPLPDFAHVQRELARPGVTRQLLWEEYRDQHSAGLGYSAFCEHYRDWLAQHVDPVMRFEHLAGDKCFIDYAGHTASVIDRATGEIRQAQIFIATLGCSNYTFAEATESQSLPDWLGSHVRAFEFFGGVPGACVPDNLKSGITHPHRYDPELNRAYADLAQHYAITILPARVRKPRDKAKVENAVQVVERWILAKLRDRQFFSLTELNAAIADLLVEYNQRAFQKMEGSRHSRFIELDRPALKPLPARPYEYATWKSARVFLDYHIEIAHAYYSVPFEHIHAQVDVRLTARMIEIFLNNTLIATHIRSYHRGARMTNPAHRPEKHCAVIDHAIDHGIDWTIAQGQRIGEPVAEVLRREFKRKKHPEEALRGAKGILRMADDHSPDKLIAACEQALRFGCFGYRNVLALIKAPSTESGTDATSPGQLPLLHDNVRGPDFYN